MNTRIRLLDENLIRKIAAGEVIERPASVVKELAENSLDAEASRIRLETQDGGRQLISVADNGQGMASTDAEMCTRRHATSKMAKSSDLFAIQTLGFRGEALASIAAVSRLRIETRAADEAEGTCLTIEGGVQRGCSTCARGQGTTVTVRSLFFNTPARRKFLRQRTTELRHITNAVVHLAAARPDVGFQLHHDGRLALDMLPGEAAQRAAELLGIPLGQLIPVEQNDSGIAVRGYLRPDGVNTTTGAGQFLMVRGRPIAASGLRRAVTAGYGGLLREGTQAAFVLWLDLDSALVDVNVHPTKREIRLADEAQVTAVIESAVRAAVRGPTAPVLPSHRGRSEGQTESKTYREPSQEVNLKGFPAAHLYPGSGAQEPGHSHTAEGAGTYHAAQSAATTHEQPTAQQSASPEQDSRTEMKQDVLSLLPPADVPLGMHAGTHTPDDPHADRARLAPTGPDRRAWQVHGEYILVQAADGLLVVDQQAAHERVLYERALAAFGSGAESQQLLFPVTLRLGAAELEAARQAADLLNELGFSVREFGKDTMLLDAVPVELSRAGEQNLLRRMLSDLAGTARQRDASAAQHAVASAYARRAAIAQGQRLSDQQVNNLLDDLGRTAEPFRSPRGQATVLRLTLDQIRKLFQRQTASSNTED